MSVQVQIQECIDQFAEIKTRVDILAGGLEKKRIKAEGLQRQIDRFIKARWVLVEVAKHTQERFKKRVETLVTMAIKSVFDRPYGFELIFERKRNKLEARPVIYEITSQKKKILYEDPEEDVGGSMVDIISFALRIVLWSFEKPRSRDVILLDEPLKNMGRLISLGGRVLREVSHWLVVQLVIITHDEELKEIADRTFIVKHNGEYSEVKRVGEAIDDEKPSMFERASTQLKRRKRK